MTNRIESGMKPQKSSFGIEQVTPPQVERLGAEGLRRKKDGNMTGGLRVSVREWREGLLSQPEVVKIYGPGNDLKLKKY